MAQGPLGLVLIATGMACLYVSIGVRSGMQKAVAKLAPPKTNRPLKNLSEALDMSRVKREYQRLFPERAKKKLMLMRISMIVGIACLVLGAFLSK